MIKYGILGCGEHALRAHALPGKDIESLKLQALCDVDVVNMQKLREAYGSDIPLYADQGSFFASNIHAVVIATPDAFHIANLRSAIRANLHILVEKPLASDGKQLEGLSALFDEALERRLIISSCHPRRFDPPFVWAKSNLPGLIEDFGQVIHFAFDFSYHESTKDWKSNRSLLLDHLNHDIDLLNFLFGHSRFSARKQSDSFDRYEAVGMRDDGISFHFQGTRCLKSHRFMEWMTIRFERGEVRVDTEKGVATILIHENRITSHRPCGATDYPNRFKAVMQNFADAILQTQRCYLSRADLWVNTAAGIGLVEQGSFEY